MRHSRLTLLFACAWLAGCTLPQALPEANNRQAPANAVVVIGKFELVPPFNSELEQETHWNIVGDGQILNQFAMATARAPQPVNTDQFAMKEWRTYIDAQWGKPFAVEARRQTTYLNGGMTQLDLMSQDRLWFPSQLYFEAPDDAAAVYIGTLRYTRNDFNRIVKVEVIDEYSQTVAELGPQYGVAGAVQKSLLKPVD